MNRYILQRLCLPNEDSLKQIDNLYFNGDAIIEDESLIIESGKVLFNTYFNSFSIAKWRKYTVISDIYVKIRAKGEYSISIHNAFIKNNELSDVIISESKASGECVLEIPREVNQGIVFIEFSALSPVHLYSIDYTTSHEPRKIIELAIGICTFKREDFVYSNMRHISKHILSNDESVLNGHLEVFISDNGHTLQKECIQNSNIHLFTNLNYGGAGGFTRTIIESVFQYPKPFDYIVLMDDDIVLDYQVLERTYRLLSFLSDKFDNSMIGGALIAKETPTIQVENGCLFTAEGEYYKINNNLDLSDVINVIKNEIESEANYNGWYYCCIPTRIITESNLPLPIFIHYDDVDYGTRNGFPQIQLGGIAVWHPNTIGKDPLWMSYYNMRNLLILQSRNNSLSLRRLLKELVTAFLYVVSYQYGSAEISIMALRDYLKGPTRFRMIDPIKLHQKLVVYKYINEPLPSDYQLNCVTFSAKSYYLRGFLYMLLPTKNDVVFVPGDSYMCDTFRYKRIGFVNKVTNTVIYHKKNLKETRRISRMFIKTVFLLFRRKSKATKEWHEAYKDMSNLNFWKKYLKLT